MKKIRISELILYLIVFGLLIQVNFIIRKINTLHNSIQTLIQMRTLEIGDEVQSLSFLDLADNKFEIKFKEYPKDVMLFTFTVDCPHCLKNIAYWNNISESIDTTTTTIFAVTMDSLEKVLKFINEYNIQFPVVFSSNPEKFMNDYKTYRVPQTIKISKGGIVRNIHLGGLTSALVEKMIKNK